MINYCILIHSIGAHFMMSLLSRHGTRQSGVDSLWTIDMCLKSSTELANGGSSMSLISIINL